MRRCRWRAIPGFLLLVAPVVEGQQTDFDRAFELERRGSTSAAAEAYRRLLARHPADANVLLGLERTLSELGQPGAMAVPASDALRAQPADPVLYGVAVRAWTAAGVGDSARRIAERWGELDPGSEAPWREWGYAALARRDREEAKEAFLAGRARLGRPEAMAGELAQLATVEGSYGVAAEEWRHAFRDNPGYRGSALALLGQVPADRRPAVLAALDGQSDPALTGVAAALAARWGDPLAGFRMLSARLPSGPEGTGHLSDFLEELKPMAGREAAQARGRTLEAIADRTATSRERWLAEAARAYVASGDQESARRLLARVGTDTVAAPALAAAAGGTMVSVLIAEGRFEEAERRLGELEGVVEPEEHDRLRQELVRGLLGADRLERADGLVAGDSTVEGLALRGRVRLLQGRLAEAVEDLTAAGPYALDRDDATARAGLLALLQVLDADSLPALGDAFRALQRGDSAAAVRMLSDLAASLPPERGGAELRLLAGRVAARGTDTATAETLLRGAAAAKGTAAAPAARLELARLMARTGRRQEAAVLLEQLILDDPGSALAPQARRMLDTLRGAVPGP
jgi:tetratricopeptide (TPR) repeat protein